MEAEEKLWRLVVWMMLVVLVMLWSSFNLWNRNFYSLLTATPDLALILVGQTPTPTPLPTSTP